MKKTYIRAFNGKIMGSVEEQPNGDKILKNFYGKPLGKYEKRTDLTKDFYGRVIAKGDVLVSLLM